MSTNRARSEATKAPFATTSCRVGSTRLGEVQRRDVQRIADDLLPQGRDPSTIRNALMPLRVIFRRAVEDGDVAVNPRTHLRLPAVRGRRERSHHPRRRSSCWSIEETPR